MICRLIHSKLLKMRDNLQKRYGTGLKWNRISFFRYKRKGKSCLGMDFRTQAVSWVDGGQEKKRADKKPERYFSPLTRQLLHSDSLLVLPLSESTPTSSDPYIGLTACTEEQNSFTQAHVSWVNPLGIYDAGTSMWLEGKGQPEVKVDHQDDPGTGSTQLTSRVEEFNRKLRENPTDIQMWLDFVQYQVLKKIIFGFNLPWKDQFIISFLFPLFLSDKDELAFGSGSFSAIKESDVDARKMSHCAVLEKKLSIMDKAVESNPGNVDLKLEKLRLCKELWEPAVLLKEWKKLVFVHPNSASLWRKYLLFEQSHFSTFSVSKVNTVFGKCLSTLGAVQDGSMVSHPQLPGTEEDVLGNVMFS